MRAPTPRSTRSFEFYPSTANTNGENDRYVIYNTREQHWTIGTMTRTVWEDSGTFQYPLAI